MQSIAVLSLLLLATSAAARQLTGSPSAGAKVVVSSTATKPAATAAVAKPAAAAPSVAAALQSSPELSTLLAAVKAAGITIPEGVTILAPTNEAFEERLKKDLNTTAAALLLPSNKDLLVKVLQYHVIPAGAVTSSQLKDGQKVTTLLSGAAPLTVKIKSKDGKTYVKFEGATNSVKVVTADIKAGSSIVHVVKDVLLPAGVGIAGDQEGWNKSKGEKAPLKLASTASPSVAAALQSSPDLSTLLAAVKAAGITIAPTDAYTILAPTNEAFEERLKKDLNTTAAALLLPSNKDLLVKVLQYHVIPAGAVTSSQLKDGQKFTTLLSGAAPLVVKIKSKDGKTYVKFEGATNSAKVVAADIKAGSSIVHVVKDVLLPAGVGIAGDQEGWSKSKGEKAPLKLASTASPSVAAALQSSPDLSTLLAVVKAAGITIAPTDAYTILAPTNEAFEERLKKDLNTTAAALLLPSNKDLLVKVLQYHVIPAGAVTSSQLKDGQKLTTLLSGAAPLVVKIKSKDGKTYVKFEGATNSVKVVAADIKAGSSIVHVVKDVLLPAGVGIAGDQEGWSKSKGEKAATAKGEKATTSKDTTTKKP